MKLYHYTGFDTFIYYILPEMRLKFFPFSTSNDPFEFSRLFQIDLSDFSIQYGNELAKEYFNQMNKYRFVCFSKSKANIEGYKLPTMWAHYGEKHNGVCLEIDLEMLDLKNFKKGSIIKKQVRYGISTSENKIILGLPRTNENINEFIRRSISEHIKTWELTNLFTKLKDWKIENEYRIVYKDDNDSEQFIDISNALTKVYLGIHASQNWQDSTKLKILDHLIGEKNRRLNKEIKLEYLRNESHKLDSTNLHDIRFVFEKNKELFLRNRQK